MLSKMDRLLSVPPNMCRHFAACEPDAARTAFGACDPPGRPLGSGGGTAHVLAEAWRAQGAGRGFDSWLAESRKAVIHGGGQSRRLPAYAAAGKLFIPVPVFRWAMGQRLDQTLLDVQATFLNRVAAAAGAQSRVMVVSGDVLLRGGESLPTLPDADVVLLGLWTRPEEARHFGVMFCERNDPARLVTFRQKPEPDAVREMARDYLFLVDVGVWLLSERAVLLLMRKCGWLAERAGFENELPDRYDLYGTWGPALGSEPAVVDPEIRPLTCAVVPLPDGEFYHFGRSRDIIDSAYRLQNLVMDQTKLGMPTGRPHPRQFIINASFDLPLGRDTNHTLWVENSHVPAAWTLASEHVITGVPANDWRLTLPAGVCLDVVPLDGTSLVLRPYGIDDPFRGAVGQAGTQWMGGAATDWLTARGLSLAAAGIDPACDIHDAPLFWEAPSPDAIDGGFVQWLCRPSDNAAYRERWLAGPRHSAAELGCRANLRQLYRQRRRHLGAALPRMAGNYQRSIFHRLDLQATARLFVAAGVDLDSLPMPSRDSDPLTAVHDRVFRAVVLRERGVAGAADGLERDAFDVLRDAIVAPYRQSAVRPVCRVLEDQIVWARAPVRLDLAGGWSDTPPYCLQCGGAVLNMAVDLNGQPPIQVFARLGAAHELVIRSIDLGREERLTTYADVGAYADLRSGFAVARAALALAGFHPDFNGGAYATLREQLAAFGGGIELSTLAAVPKGSGLGTSSILAATLLGALSDLAGLGWDHFAIINRTLAVEQMLTSGGGWQDQVGGVLHGVKLAQTRPGMEQTPVVRWLPESLFETPELAGRVLLYYTGITRVARGILGEIVRGMFLNSRQVRDSVEAIAANAHFAYDALQRHDGGGLAAAIRRSWTLNQQLDAGTNVPAVAEVLDRCGADLVAAKLLGAGGGGYLLLMARSARAADAIRARLEDCPPNAKARFVGMSISRTGLQVTRS
jgi:galactokinase/mevalonate kinase-like predicted kinase